MKVLCILLVTLVATSQARTLEDRSISSSMQQITHFLHNAMRVVGSGCKAVTKYVTGPVCTAMGIVPKGTEVGACGVFTVGYEVCVAIAEGTRTYCNTLGFSLPGTPAVDEIICKAVHAAGKK